MSRVPYVSPESLAAQLRQGEAARRKLQLLDVRDDDYAGGNIRGTLHIDSPDFTPQRAAALARELQGTGVEEVIVNCMMSQNRGVAAANLLREQLEQQGAERPRVKVLQGGWRAFSRLPNIEDLVENRR